MAYDYGSGETKVSFAGKWIGFSELQGKRIVQWFYSGGLVVILLTWLVYIADSFKLGRVIKSLQDYGEMPYEWWEGVSLGYAILFTVAAVEAIWVLRLGSELAIVAFRVLDELIDTRKRDTSTHGMDALKKENEELRSVIEQVVAQRESQV